jgi:hypothetical protein
VDPDLFWQVGGNAGTNPIPVGPNFVGTTDDTELVLGVNGTQALRLSFYSDEDTSSVNVLGGHPVNRIVNAYGATIGGGGSDNPGLGSTSPNKVEANFGTISGGANNGVLGAYGVIGGGSSNTIFTADSSFSVIAGGLLNTVEGESGRSVIGGGESNTVTESLRGTIGGGRGNLIHGQSYATIVGGQQNASFRAYTFIGGGFNNRVCDPDEYPDEDYPLSAGQSSFIGGGQSNSSCAGRSFIGSGFANNADGVHSMIIGGAWNRTMGRYSLVAGHFSEAREDYGIALGRYAHSLHEGAFVWADSSSLSDFESQREDQFRLRATGGARFDVNDSEWVEIRSNTDFPDDESFKWRLIDTSTGAYLSLGGGWVNASDRDRKTDIRDVDADWVLEQVAALPIQTWRYKVEHDSVRHIGPMAQDFQAAFGYGGDPRGIMSVDADGVALAAIQALYRMTAELERRTRQLEAQQQRLDTLEAGLRALEARLDPFDGQRLAHAEVGLGSE